MYIYNGDVYKQTLGIAQFHSTMRGNIWILSKKNIICAEQKHILKYGDVARWFPLMKIIDKQL